MPPDVELKLTVTPDGGEFRLTRSAGEAPLRATLPLASFCRLAHGGDLVAEPVEARGGQSDQAIADPRPPPIAFDVAAMDGVKQLFDEACP